MHRAMGNRDDPTEKALCRGENGQINILAEEKKGNGFVNL